LIYLQKFGNVFKGLLIYVCMDDEGADLNSEDISRIARLQSSVHHTQEEMLAMLRGMGRISEQLRDPDSRQVRQELRYGTNCSEVLTGEDLAYGMHLIGPNGPRSRTNYQPRGSSGYVEKF